MAMCFQYDYQRQFNYSIIQAVGPTSELSQRGTLPESAPDNTNSFFVSPAGDDGDSGDMANPKATIAAGLALLTPARPTLVIIRHTHIGDLTFTLSANVTLPASRNIQVEDGEMATLRWATANDLTLSASSKINGLIIEFTSTGGIVSSTNSEMTNCKFISPNAGFFVTINGTTDKILFCHFYSPGGAVSFANGVRTGYEIENNIFQRSSTLLADKPGIEITQSADVTATLLFVRCLFVGFSGSIITTYGETYAFGLVKQENAAVAVKYVAGASTGLIKLDFHACVFLQTDISVSISGFGSAVVNPNFEIAMDYCQDNSTAGIVNVWNSNINYVNPDYDQVITNPIAVDVPRLYVNESAGLSGDITGFQLQRAGKSTLDGTGRYFIDSPLVGAWLAGPDPDKDISPWRDQITETNPTLGQTLIVDWPPASVVIPNEVKNPVTVTDVNGNLHTDYDAFKRAFQFTYGDAVHLSNQQWRRLSHMLQDRGVKKFFPLGEGANLYTTGGATTLPATFSNVDNSIEPTASDVMIPNHWRGFWVTIGASEYYIVSNDYDKIYLADKKGDGFPANGTVDFSIQFMLVQNEPTDFVIKQQNFTSFLKGGSLANDDESVRNYDYVIDGFTVKEVEDFEENL